MGVIPWHVINSRLNNRSRAIKPKYEIEDISIVNKESNLISLKTAPAVKSISATTKAL